MLHASHHQFWLTDTGQLPQPSGAAGNGLILVTQPGAAVVFTGIHTGRVSLTVEARDRPPADVDTSGWDEVVEVSMNVPAGHLRPVAMMAEGPDRFPDLTVGAGDHRIRVYARGRDTDVDGVAEEPFEEYWIVAWPHPAEPDRTYRQSDGYGASLREAATRAPVARARAERPDDPNRAALDARLRRARGDR